MPSVNAGGCVYSICLAASLLGGPIATAEHPKVLAVLSGHTNSVRSLAFSADGRTLVSGGFDKTVRVWDVAAGKERATLLGHTRLIDHVAVTPDGQIAMSVDQGGIIILWDVPAAQTRLTINTDKGRPNSMQLMTDGQTLALQWNDHTIERWDVISGQSLVPIRKEENQLWDRDGSIRAWNGPASYELSPDGRTAVVTAPRVNGVDPIGLWDVAAGKLRFTLPKIGHYALSTVEFHPGGRIFLVGHAKGHETFQLINVTTGETWAAVKGNNHNESCFQARFTKDGSILATAEGPDTEIRLWDVSGLWHVGLVKKAPLPASELEALWNHLADDDAAKAHRAIWELAARSQEFVPLLSERLRPVVAADEKSVARSINDLNSDRFSVREEATRALEKLGDAAGPALRKASADTTSMESGRRIELLLARLDHPASIPERLQELRAVESLEHAGTPEARQVLKKLAGGLAEAPLTREAKASIERLKALAFAATGMTQATKPRPDEDTPAVRRDTLKGGLYHSMNNWQRITGKVKVKNGYTIVFENGAEVDFVNGPELEQMGMLDGKLYPAGKEAAEFLQKLIGDRPVTMYVNATNEQDQRGNRTGRPFVGEAHLTSELIRHGWAFATHSSMVPMELMARENKRGMWRGQFVSPDDWRAGKRLPGEK